MARPVSHAGRILALGLIAIPARVRGEESAGQPSASPPAVENKAEGAAPSPAPPAAVAPKPTAAPPPIAPPATVPAQQPATASPTTPGQPPTVVSLIPAPPPTAAAIHIAANYSDAWLEGRSRVDLGEWKKLCPAPCDRTVRVDGLELRMTAPHMTPSNAFVIEPGAGTARLRIGGGSSTARDFGIAGLVGGLSVSFAGMTLFGFGSFEDEKSVRTAGIATLAVGAVATLASLPLLLIGATTVKNEKGAYIARAARGAWSF